MESVLLVVGWLLVVIGALPVCWVFVRVPSDS